MMTATPNASSADPLPNRVPQVFTDNRNAEHRKLSKLIHEQNRALAAKLHKARFIYALYGALDGVSLSYSMVKLMFDMHYPDANTSSDKMHDWMMTPGGLSAVAAESMFIIAWSMMGNIYKDDDKDPVKAYAALLWGYGRLSMKALKNAYKGVRGLMQVVNTLGLADMRSMVVPVGVLLGGLSVLNRIWYRYEVSQRKEMMEANDKFLKELQDFDKDNQDANSPPPFPENKIAHYREALAKQRAHYSHGLKFGLLASMAYGGIVDSLYLYLGILGLSVLAPQLYVAMCVFTVMFSLACVAVRVYEEYDFQRKLDIAQLKVELAICGRELESLLFIEIERVIQHARQNNAESLNKGPIALDDKIEEFDALRDKLQSLSQLSPLSAAMVGVKDGLAAYSMIASILFATGTVCAMMSVAFPPFLMVTGIVLGMVSMLCLAAFEVAMNRPPVTPPPANTTHERHATQSDLIQQLNTAKPEEKLPILLQILKEDQHAVGDIKKTVIKDAIWERMNVDVSPQFYFQEWFEVARSFFSGMAKGQKTVDYTLNPMQAQGKDGHYHETPLMSGLAVVSASVFSMGLALRADAKGFGRLPSTSNTQAVLVAANDYGRPAAALSVNVDDAALPIQQAIVADELWVAPHIDKPATPGLDILAVEHALSQEDLVPLESLQAQSSRRPASTSWPPVSTHRFFRPIPKRSASTQDLQNEPDLNTAYVGQH